jgi:peptidoglycan/xylan/chitin deacetylase (PgdA/CDA1 family)
VTADDRVIHICFHGIGTPGRELEPGEAGYWLNVDSFRRILDELATLSPVQLSFDDSNASDAEIALPELVQRGLRADFFVIAGRLGTPGSLDEDGVRELLRNGMGIGSHGMHHRPWQRLDADTSHDEFVTAREKLAVLVGSDIDTAACPLGRYDRRSLRDLRRLGYRRVFTSDRRPARRDAWLQPRYSLQRGDTAAAVREIVLGRPSLSRRIWSAGVGLVKRWR